jgi:hypothetical protein
VQPRFFNPARLAVKALELIGAGLASTLAAYFFGQIGTPLASPPPLAQVTSNDAELVRMLRDEHALVLELGKELEIHRKTNSVSTASIPTPAPKPSRSVQVTPSHSQKAETATVEAKPRTGEPLLIQLAIARSESFPKILEPSPKSNELSEFERPIRVSAAPNEWMPVGLLKRIGAWFVPGNGEAPRPPMPVGESMQDAM